MAKLLVASVLILLVSHGSSFFLPFNGGSTGGPSQGSSSDDMDNLKYPKGSMFDSWFGVKNIQSDLDDLRYPTQPLITAYISKAIGIFSQIQASFRNFDSQSQLSPIIANKLSFLRQSVQSTLGFGGQSAPNKKLYDDFDDFDSDVDSGNDSVSSDKSDDGSSVAKADDDAKSDDDTKSDDETNSDNDTESDDDIKTDDDNKPSNGTNDDDFPSIDSNDDKLPSITSTDDKNVFFAEPLDEKNETPLTSSAIESESDSGATTTSTTTESTNTSVTEDTDFDSEFNADILETTSAADEDSKTGDKEDSLNEV